MRSDRDIDEAVRALDSARDLDTHTSTRATADLEHILATAPDPSSRQPQTSPRARRSGAVLARRASLAGGLVAAATAGVLVVGAVTGGEPAYASWTASPSGLDAEETAAAAQGCRDNHARSDATTHLFPQLDDAQVALAERRGDWTMVVLTGDGDFFADCLTPDLTAGFGQDGDWSAGASAGDQSPSPRELTMKTSGIATLAAGPVSVVAGLAGEDVTDVSYSSSSHGEITATVSGGAYALWFPGDELDGPQLASIDLQVSYRDGSTETKHLAIRETS